MLDDSDDIDTTTPRVSALKASEAFDEVMARRPAKPPQHPKYAFRAAIQASRELKGAPKLVGLLLADFVNVDEGYAYPTVSEIMVKLGMPETTVHRALRTLQGRKAEDGTFSQGWFRREAMKSRNGADARNHWHPIYARAGISDSEGGGCQNDRGGCHQRHPRVPSTAPLIHTGYLLDSIEEDEPSQSKTVGGQNEGAKLPVLENERESRASDRSTGFDREWPRFRDVYPGRTDGDRWKGAYIKARMSGASAETLMAGVKAYVLHLNSGVIDAPMHVAKWLSEERWTDEYGA